MESMSTKFHWRLAGAYLLFIGLGWLQRSLPGSWNGQALLSGSLWAIGLAIVGTFVLMGLPGALLLGLYRLLGLLPKQIAGNQLWPAAVVLSLVWPLGLPIGQLLSWIGVITGQTELELWGTAAGLSVWILIAGLLLRRQK